MFRGFFAFLLVLVVAGAIGLYLSAFIVRQTEQAIQLRFGKIQAVISEPGLYWRIPFADEIAYFDKRILDLDLEPKAIYSKGQKQVIVDAFARFKITDPLEFYKTVRTEARARARLGTFMEAALRRVLGNATLEELVRDKRSDLTDQINKIVNEAGRELGVQVVDVRIKRADLPEANSVAIYRRMESERKREAESFRAEGRAQANRIRAEADREATVIIANAEKKSQQLRGEGDSIRNRIFADAFGKDPQFFAFYRSMQAYEKGLASGDTRMVISPNSEFFRYFNNLNGTAPKAK